MKRLPDSELELMQIIWDAGHPVTRLEIEYQLPVDREAFGDHDSVLPVPSAG